MSKTRQCLGTPSLNMTKKHYEAIAAIVREHTTKHADWYALVQATKQMADYFTTENPKFDRARFLQACGIDQ